MKATVSAIQTQAMVIAAHAEALADKVDSGTAHARALLLLEQATTLVAWTEEEPEPHPKVGDWADHITGELDPRQVARVSPNGKKIWITITDGVTAGPLLAENYTFKPDRRKE